VSSPNVLDKSKPSVPLRVHAVAVLDEQHYKSDACVSHVHESVFGASDACEDVRAYEGAVLYVLPPH